MSKAFSLPAWARNINIYEVNVRQYTREGTFKAFARELPRLYQMGVKMLWFMPVTPISQKNKKGSLGSYYACSNYTAINPEFGTMEDFKDLLRLAKENGFRVIIDWVANHTGWDHHWTIEHPDYYIRDPQTSDFKMASGMEDIIELDYKNPEMRKAMIDAMQFWVRECGIDGFRCDLASWVELDFWMEARTAIDAAQPLFWLGEFDELEDPEYGSAFDASYAWLWMHRTEDFYKQGGQLNEWAALVKRYSVLGDQTARAWFTSNHDENTWNGTEYEKYGSMAKALAVFSCTWNGIPLIYSGQELPMINHRLKFFDKDPIPWTGEYGLQDFYRVLLGLHSSNPAANAFDPDVHSFIVETSQPEEVFAFLRMKEDHEILVVLNLSGKSLPELTISDMMVTGVFKSIFSTMKKDFSHEGKFELGPWEYYVMER